MLRRILKYFAFSRFNVLGLLYCAHRARGRLFGQKRVVEMSRGKSLVGVGHVKS